jgi:hypothetical protein
LSPLTPAWSRPLPRIALTILVLVSAPRGLHAQNTTGELFAGDSVRVDGVLIGRVIGVDGTTATVISREKPRCRAGQGHGDAPICDPAPVIRREIDLRVSTVERRMEKGNTTTRTLVGGVLGAVAFGAAGYAIGPSIGFGKVEGCLEGSVNPCDPEDVVSPDELEARQKKSDQRRGAFFFGVVGGTASAILARKLATGWVRFEPSFPAESDGPWGLTVVLPGLR